MERESVATSKNNKLKSQVMKTVYKFVETATEILLLQIGRIALLVSKYYFILVYRIHYKKMFVGLKLTLTCKML